MRAHCRLSASTATAGVYTTGRERPFVFNVQQLRQPDKCGEKGRRRRQGQPRRTTPGLPATLHGAARRVAMSTGLVAPVEGRHPRCQPTGVSNVSATQSATKRVAFIGSSRLQCSTPPSRSVNTFSSRLGLLTACS